MQYVVPLIVTQTVLADVKPPGTGARPSDATQTLAVVPVVGVYTQVAAWALPAGTATTAATAREARRIRDMVTSEWK
jgi:hypothetical protein